MSGKLLPEIVVGEGAQDQPGLPLAAEGVQRIVCKLKYADILVEVEGDAVYVNGERVEPWRSAKGESGPV